MHLEVDKDAFHCHAASTQAVVVVLLPPGQLPHIGHEGVGWVPYDERDLDDDITDDEVGDPGGIGLTFRQPRKQGVVWKTYSSWVLPAQPVKIWVK